MQKNTIGPIECRDTALAVIFLLFLIWFFTRETVLIYAAMGFTLYAMVLPKTLTPLARLWFGFSHYLGLVMSKVILGLIYTVIVLPVAFIRKLMGRDGLRLRTWKKDTGSAFVVRDQTYAKEDLTNLF